MSEEDERRSTVSRIGEAKRQPFKEGQHIFREHETGDAAYVVLDGNVQIYRTTETGEQPLAVLHKGAMFGEMALIDNSLRMASAKIVGGPAELLVVTRDAFQKRIQGLDPFTRGLIKILADNLRVAQK